MALLYLLAGTGMRRDRVVAGVAEIGAVVADLEISRAWLVDPAAAVRDRARSS